MIINSSLVSKIFVGIVVITFGMIASNCSYGHSSVEIQPSPQSSPSGLNQVPLIRPSSNFPGFISGMAGGENRLIAVENNICVQIEQKALWKPGDYWDDFENMPVVHIFINGDEVKTLRRTLTGVLQVESDSNGQVIGTHGFGIETCVNLTKVSVKRDNVMKFEVVYQADTLLSASWNFIFEN